MDLYSSDRWWDSKEDEMYKIVKAADGYEVRKGMQTICTGLTFEQATRAKSYLENK